MAGRRGAARCQAFVAVATGRTGIPGLRLAGRVRGKRRWRRAVNQRKHLTLIAAGAAFLSALPLINVFEHYTWAMRAFMVVAVMCGVAILVRSLRAPAWAP